MTHRAVANPQRAAAPDLAGIADHQQTGGTITGTITATVTIGTGAYASPLTITSTGAVLAGAAGVTGVYGATAGDILVNVGTIIGGAGSAAAFSVGGIGVDLAAAGTVTNTGHISGGAGGQKYGDGGIGVLLQSGGTINNSGSITGGAAGAFNPGSGPKVTAGAGVDLASAGVLNNSAAGSIIGGAGGLNVAGGAGVTLQGARITDQGRITGGGGAFGGAAGGAGIAGSGVITVASGGVVTGGAGAAATNGQTGGLGGDGMALTGAIVTNMGTITGGTGATTTTGGAGVYLNGGLLMNAGTISGAATGKNGAGQFAVILGPKSSTLIMEAGGVLNGGVYGEGANDRVVLNEGTGAHGVAISLTTLFSTIVNVPSIILDGGTYLAVTNQSTIVSGVTFGVNGYGTLNAKTLLAIAAGGTVIDSGVILGNVTDAGSLQLAAFSHLTGRAGAAGTSTKAGATGGTGVQVLKGARLNNAGILTGGRGGAGDGGGAGGVGVTIAAGGTVANSGAIVGGAGGGPLAGGPDTASLGAGGTGLILAAAGTLTNTGLILGGAGYASGADGNFSQAGAGGLGLGVAAGGIFTNSGSIVGGAGGASHQVTGQRPGQAGIGGVGASVANAAATNSGFIAGGAGGASYVAQDGGNGGTALVFTGATFTNSGTIIGGAGGSGASLGLYGGNGGTALIVEGGATVIDSGTLQGGAAGNAAHDSGEAGDALMFLGAGGTLLLDPTAQINGVVLGTGNQTLVLAAGATTGTLASTAGASTAGASTAGQFVGFYTATENAGAAWSFGNTLSFGVIDLGQGASLTNTGDLTIHSLDIYAAGAATIVNSGTIFSSGPSAIYILGGGGVVDNTGTIVGGAGAGIYLTGTLTNAGTITGGNNLGVVLGAGSTLVTYASAHINGYVIGTNATLVLAGTQAATLAGIGSHYTGFSNIDFDAGTSWTVAGSAAALSTAGSIAFGGFGLTDEIILNNFVETTESYVAGTGVVLGNGSNTYTLGFTGSYGTNVFTYYAAGGETTIHLHTLVTSVSTAIATEITLGHFVYAANLTVTSTGNVTPATAGATAIYAINPGVTLTNAGSIAGGAFSSSASGTNSGGTGLDFTQGGSLDNTGTIRGATGEAGYDTGGIGGIGVSIAPQGSVTNSGTIAGGAGGGAYNFNDTGQGGNGNTGLTLGGGTLTNTGVIGGGAGGYGGLAGGGGIGANLTGVTGTNAGILSGGSGGPSQGEVLQGGNGADGLVMSAGAFINTNEIIGGNGTGGYFTGGYAGNGASVSGAGVLTNSGFIGGGGGGSSSITTPTGGFYSGGNGGAGVILTGASLVNTGTIHGGGGGSGVYAGYGGNGVAVYGGVVTTSGTISAGGAGGGTGGHSGDAVYFAGSAAGTLIIDPGAVFNGNVAASSSQNDMLELAGTAAGTLSGLGAQFTGFTTFSETTGAIWTLKGASTLGAATTATISGALTVGGLFTDTAGITIAGAGLLKVNTNDSLLAGTLTLAGGKLIDSASTTIVVGTTLSGALENDITVQAGAEISGNGSISSTGTGASATTLLDNGTITATGGTLVIATAIAGTGLLEIANESALVIDQAANIGSVAFATGHETLSLAAPTSFTAPISGFAGGDVIDLQKLAATSLSFQSGTLSLLSNNGATVLDKLIFSGAYTTADFTLASDTHGGVDLEFTAAAAARALDFAPAPDAHNAFLPDVLASHVLDWIHLQTR